MIPHARPVMSDKEARYLQECVTTNFVSSVGPFVDRLERQLAEATGAASAVATSSGTTALHASLLTVGVGRDDLVILPSFTFIASANAIAHCGAMPWLMDIDAETWTLDADLLRRSLEAEARREGDRLFHVPTGRRIAAIMPVHTLGVAADDWRLPIVADAAAALGATFRGKPIGGMGAELSVISFNGNKTVTAGGGGMIVGDDPALMRLARHLTTTARAGEEYSHDRVGYNYRMTNLQAAVGCAQMERWETLVEAKRRIRRRYDEAFGNMATVGGFPDPGDRESACWLSGIRLRPPAPSVEVVRDRLRAEDIETRAFWKPVHQQLPYKDAPASAMPVTDALWPTILTLPCSTDLSETDQGRVIDAVRSAIDAA